MADLMCHRSFYNELLFVSSLFNLVDHEQDWHEKSERMYRPAEHPTQEDNILDYSTTV